MLTIIVPSVEYYDEIKEEFVPVTKEQTLKLEHSLLSLYEWESKWNKAWYSRQEKTVDETTDYIRCMTLNQDVDPKVYDNLSTDNINQVKKYLEAPLTAIHFPKDKLGGSNNETITNELIYYWMVALNIPFTCEKWHLNHLFNLVRVCNLKAKPPKKGNQRDSMSRNAALNAARRKQYNTKG